MIGRRGVLALGLSSVLAPRRVIAQSSRQTRSVVVIAPSRAQLQRFAFFEAAMKERAAIDGIPVTFAVQFAANHPGGAAGIVADVAASKPDVIVAANTPIVHAALAAGSDIPIVMAIVGDREGAGVVRRTPGQNVTGVTTLVGAMAAKRLSFLKEAAPTIRNVLALYHPDDPIVEPQLRDLAEAAPSLGVMVRPVALREPDELDAIFDGTGASGMDAVFRLAGQSARTLRRTIELTRARQLPSMHVLQDDVREGGLMAYYASFEEHWERVAAIVERILKGTPARDLPIEQPTRFELVLNLQTARAIGLPLSPAFLAQADEVIE